MKFHLVVKLHQPLSNDSAVPNWLDFITDKSVIRETVTPDVDRVLRDAGLQVWVTKEYRPAQAEWAADELREGLDRTTV